jgi:hypothetical protein
MKTSLIAKISVPILNKYHIEAYPLLLVKSLNDLSQEHLDELREFHLFGKG